MSQKAKRVARSALLSQYGSLYSRWHPDEGAGCCVYCGETATCLDHCPPLSSADLVVSDRRAREKYDIHFRLFQSCTDCNTLLGDKPFFNLLERAEYVARKLEKEYEKKFTLWSAEEEKPMSPMFKRIIQSRRSALSELSRRARWAQWRLCNLDGTP